MSRRNHIKVVESEAETSDSDYSLEDPSSNILEETLSNFSNLSIKKKPKSRVPVEVDENNDFTETSTTEFDANDQNNYEIVQKIIEVCQVEKLKVEQCKLYLRKHGLRLTGKKDVLIQRIKEHISIMNGEGEHKYPVSRFVMNCKGDACTGDVVLFEQNVYEMFNIASRSSSGPSCGTRTVAGRIVKESYGAAKQQHTFTIEVLWSKGVKPLPPLHPLLIKGRNLYRLKTMRQRWEDENQRQKILTEKHARGNAARSNREARLLEKETRNALRESRASKRNTKNEKQEKERKTSAAQPMITSKTSNHHGGVNLPAALSNPHADAPSTRMVHNNYHRAPYKENVTPRKSFQDEENMRFSCPPKLFEKHDYDHRGSYHPRNHINPGKSFQVEENIGLSYTPKLFERHDYGHRASIYHPQNPPPQSYSSQQINNYLPRGHHHYQGQKQQQLCRYYAQGRCHCGTNCKYLH